MKKDIKVKCIIVEDEQYTTLLMENYVSQMKNLELLGTFVSPLDVLSFDRLDEVQIIYLDIQMPGMTGVEFLKSKAIEAEIIFTTAYSKYAIEGYELNITDYLLKPVEFPRFVKATQKAIEKIRLKAQAPQSPSTPANITLKVDKKLVRVSVEDIIFVQSDWNYIHVYTHDKKYMVLRTMKAIERMLEPFNFVRIHKSYLINFDQLISLEGNMVEMFGNHRIQVSRNYKLGLLHKLQISA